MRFVTDLGKGILGEPDPVELWDHIISQIPNEVFLKPNCRILFPACGHATEVDIVVKRMRELGLTPAEINDSLYLVDKYKVFTKEASRRGYKNVIKADFLEWKTDMKFDLIVGNPPYTSGTQGAAPIWQKFINKSFELSDNIAFVVPHSLSRSPDYKDIRDQINNHGLSSYKILPKNTFKNADVHTLYFIADPNAPKGPGVWFEDATFKSIINKIESVVGTEYYDISSKDRRLVFRGVKKTDTTGNVIDSLNSNGFKIVNDTIDQDTNKHRVVTSYLPNNKHHLLALEYVKPGLGVPTKYRQLLVKDKAEGDSIVSYLKCKLPLVIYSLTKTSRTIDGPQTRFIPEVPFNKIWTDADVYKHFGLTAEEIEYVESNY
jgi:hypothetical protein